MKNARLEEKHAFRVGQIERALAGRPRTVAELCRKHGVSDASIYKWKARFGGMEVSEAKRLRILGWGLNQVHSLTTATRAMADRKFCASRSYLVAILRQFFSLQKRRSMTLRLL